MSYNWSTNPKAPQKNKNPLKTHKTPSHPLINQKTSTNFDPLSSPITKIHNNSSNFEPWSSKKTQILQKYTTQEKLSITTSTFSVPEKVLHRLEQLDLDSGNKIFYGGLSQEEYVNKINQLQYQLISAWENESRVNSLKIAIQCCKLLQETSGICFYPSKFVLITDILDIFGGLVFRRLEGRPPEVQKETCKNWFFKIGSIRELLPRLLIELSILKSSKFIENNYSKIIQRILNSIWGIADPVVAIYLRCYLCRVSINLIPENTEIYLKCFQDLMLLHDKVLDNFRNDSKLIEAKVSMSEYFSVLGPGVEFILQCVIKNGEHLRYILQLVGGPGGLPGGFKSLLLSSLLKTFPPQFIAENAVEVLEIIQTIDLNLSIILKNFGLCLIITNSNSKEIWPKVNSMLKKIRTDYLEVAVVWVEFVVANYGLNEIQNLLSDISKVKADEGKLVNLVEKLVKADVVGLLKMTTFVQIASKSPESIKNVLEAFNKVDVVLKDELVATLMHLSIILHDSVDQLTPPDQITQISLNISNFLTKVSYPNDQLLNFYSEARAAFTNLDQVQIQLIHLALKLGMDLKSFIKTHTKRTKAFLSAIIAFAFITIPSLENTKTQLKLYLLTCQVAACNSCISQSEACCRAIIDLLDESVENQFVFNFLSTLVALPDNPMEEMLYNVKLLLVNDFDVDVYVKVLTVLNFFAKESYPYSYCESNLDLYGNSVDFVNEVDNLGSRILYKVVNLMGDLPVKKRKKIASELIQEIELNCNLGNLVNKLMLI